MNVETEPAKPADKKPTRKRVRKTSAGKKTPAKPRKKLAAKNLANAKAADVKPIVRKKRKVRKVTSPSLSISKSVLPDGSAIVALVYGPGASDNVVIGTGKTTALAEAMAGGVLDSLMAEL